MSSKSLESRLLAIHELDKLINYIHSLDPELKPHEATYLAAVTLHGLPDLFQCNPLLVERFREAAADIKNKRQNPQHPMTND
ncbi:MAG: hypothetical protein V7K60_33610 [Nostoc sp.]